MATIREVAEKANVSIATVSYVLNNTKPISKEVKCRVYEAIAETGYVANSIARSLKRQETKTIGMVVTYIDNPVYSGIFKSIEKKAQLEGYAVMVCTSNDDPDIEEAQIKLLLSKKVDGLIIVPSKGSKLQKNRILPQGFPIVLINREVPGLEASLVAIRNEEAAYEVTSHLYTHHQIESVGLIIGSERPNRLSRERKTGYQKALKKHGLRYRPEWEIEGGSNFEGGMKAAKCIMEMETPPRAMFITGTTMMLGFMFQLKNMDVKCPSDIAVIGFSDSSMSVLIEPTLSSIAQPIEEMSNHTLKLILEAIENNHMKIKEVVLPCTIHYRKSCGCEWEPNSAFYNSNLKF
ncbi:LacI family DNA-binding transcriptional regulator [Shouchella shacheensis]|uniref:LacI family DNA-binding transcriptional regulator n=1 Tax=Shouchella shacheensis TaxID=1649580 RepID=UPI0007400C97|nr:LacI family DNA-binding transcriptional regulator [Shouchella shacheensis]